MQGYLKKSPIVFCFAYSVVSTVRIDNQSGEDYKILSSRTA
jgi:hypothetical protein